MGPVDHDAAARDAVVRVDHVTMRFGSRTILDNVSLEVLRGETLAILGGSGSGKSTLLRIITGTFALDEGRVELFGRDLARVNDREMDALRRRLGVVFQFGALFHSMTVGENIAWPLREHTRLDEDTIDIMVRIKLEQVGLREVVDLRPSELSGGMRKRAALARATALDPEVLFYDEPSAGLDPVTSAGIDRLIADLAKKLQVTSVVVTHDMHSAFTVADRMAMVMRGRLLKIGPAVEFAAIRDGPATGDGTTDAIRQFLRGESQGPLSRAEDVAYAEDLLETARGD